MNGYFSFRKIMKLYCFELGLGVVFFQRRFFSLSGNVGLNLEIIMKKFLKALFFIWIAIEVFALFYRNSYERYLDKYVDAFPPQEIDFKSLKATKLVAGIKHYEKGNYDRAIKYLNQSYIMEDSTKKVRFYLGLSHMQVGAYCTASTYFDFYRFDPKNQEYEPDGVSVLYGILCRVQCNVQYGFWFDRLETQASILLDKGNLPKDKMLELKSDLEKMRDGRISIFDFLDLRALVSRFRYKFDKSLNRARRRVHEERKVYQASLKQQH